MAKRAVWENCFLTECEWAMDGFDFTSQIRLVCTDIVARLPDLSHVDLSRVTIAFCQTRKRVSHGLYASLTPMRFKGGSLVTRRSGRWYTLQRVYDASGGEHGDILRFSRAGCVEVGGRGRVSRRTASTPRRRCWPPVSTGTRSVP